MGLDLFSVVSVSPHPRFSWDLRFVPRTEEQGDQQEYAKAVKKWNALCDNIADGISNIIGKANCGILLYANLYGCAKDLCDDLDDVAVTSEGGAALIVSTIYKRGPLLVVASVSAELGHDPSTVQIHWAKQLKQKNTSRAYLLVENTRNLPPWLGVNDAKTLHVRTGILSKNAKLTRNREWSRRFGSTGLQVDMRGRIWKLSS